MSRVSRPAQPRRSADAPSIGAKPPGSQWPHADDTDDAALAPQRKHTTVAEAGVQKPAGVPASAFDAGRLAKRAAAKQRNRAEPIDVDSVVVEHDVPITVRQESRAAALRQSCLALIRRMNVGDSVLLPGSQGLALTRIARKAGHALQRRVQPDGTWRVWRLADPQQPQGDAQ